mgnify:CR=1 FL=1
MIKGKIVSLNAGNFLPTTRKYTFSLASNDLARKIALKLEKIEADIIVAQEIWNFPERIFGDKYDFRGLNDTIAVKKDFGTIVTESYRSNAKRFKNGLHGTVNSIPEAQLEKDPYRGFVDSKYGIPCDFDVTSLIVKHQETGQKLLIVNVHVHSSSKNDLVRAREIRSWIIEDCWNRAETETDGRVLIAGDFNQDEYRHPDAESSYAIRELKAIESIHDASKGDLTPTTNYPIFKSRLDHIFGSASFSDYDVQQSLLFDDFKGLKHRHPLTWWMHLDHRLIYTEFEFLS